MTIKVYIFGGKTSLFGSKASGLQRVFLLDAVLGRYAYPMKGNVVGIPGILESWEAKDNARTWQLKLRKDLTFHDGKSATVEDLRYSLCAPILSKFETPELSGFKDVIGIKEFAQQNGGSIADIEGIKVVDSQTVEIKLLEPNVSFLKDIRVASFSLTRRDTVNFPGADLKGPSRSSGSHLSWKSCPIGTGPFRIIDVHDDGSRVFLEPYKTYVSTKLNRVELYTGDFEEDTDFVVGGSLNPSPQKLQLCNLEIPWAIFGFFFKFDHELVQGAEFRRLFANSIRRQPLLSVRKRGKPTSTIIPSNWQQWRFLETDLNLETSRQRFEDILRGIDFKLALIVPKSLEARNDTSWVDPAIRQLNDAGCPIEVFVDHAPDGYLEVCTISGFIPSVSSGFSLFSLFQEGSGWVPKLSERNVKYDEILQKLKRPSTSENETRLIQDCDTQFAAQALAVPLFEEPVTCFLNPKKIQSVEKERQDLAMLLHPIVPTLP